MMINRAAFSSHGETWAHFRLSPFDAPPGPASPRSSSGARGSAIALGPGVAVDLGSINGKPIEMRILPDGGYEWSGQPRGRTPGAGEITVEQVLAARMARAFTREEFATVAPILGIVHGLYLWTHDIWPISWLNAYIAEFASAAAAREAIVRLGFDPDEPFAINGRMLRLLGERFVPWDEV